MTSMISTSVFIFVFIDDRGLGRVQLTAVATWTCGSKPKHHVRPLPQRRVLKPLPLLLRGDNGTIRVVLCCFCYCCSAGCRFPSSSNWTTAGAGGRSCSTSSRPEIETGKPTNTCHNACPWNLFFCSSDQLSELGKYQPQGQYSDEKTWHDYQPEDMLYVCTKNCSQSNSKYVKYRMLLSLAVDISNFSHSKISGPINWPPKLHSDFSCIKRE